VNSALEWLSDVRQRAEGTVSAKDCCLSMGILSPSTVDADMLVDLKTPSWSKFRKFYLFTAICKLQYYYG
jgi:hypothetical protein